MLLAAAHGWLSAQGCVQSQWPRSDHLQERQALAPAAACCQRWPPCSDNMRTCNPDRWRPYNLRCLLLALKVLCESSNVAVPTCDLLHLHPAHKGTRYKSSLSDHFCRIVCHTTFMTRGQMTGPTALPPYPATAVNQLMRCSIA